MAVSLAVRNFLTGFDSLFFNRGLTFCFSRGNVLFMTNIRRHFRSGQVYFLTHVTDQRRPLLIEHIDLFRRAYNSVIDSSGTVTIAWVVLPDHFHVILDPRTNDLSDMMKRFKLRFSGLYRSRLRQGSGRVWQYRFWDHVIRDQEDLNRHIDYVHYNPVKHELVSDPFLYAESSLHEFHRKGCYERDWGCRDLANLEFEVGE
jgi:putative transposase